MVPKEEFSLTIKVRLSPRELEFIKLLIGEEYERKEIAERLNISYRTARNISQQIYVKLGLSKYGTGKVGGAQVPIISLTKWAIKSGIIQI